MDVTKLTAEQTRNILDFVLENSYHPEDYFDFKNRLLPLLVSKGYFPDQDEYLMKMSLNKLKQDGYIDFVEKKGGVDKWQFISDLSAAEGMTIRRNFAGHIFIANGGYKQEFIDTAAAKLKAAKDATDLIDWTKRLATRTKSLMIATWFVAVGAVGLVLWEMRHWIYSLFSCS